MARTSFTYLGSAVSANRLYGFERFILQNVQGSHMKMTFLKERHQIRMSISRRAMRSRWRSVAHSMTHLSTPLRSFLPVKG